MQSVLGQMLYHNYSWKLLNLVCINKFWQIIIRWLWWHPQTVNFQLSGYVVFSLSTISTEKRAHSRGKISVQSTHWCLWISLYCCSTVGIAQALMLACSVPYTQSHSLQWLLVNLQTGVSQWEAGLLCWRCTIGEGIVNVNCCNKYGFVI